MNDHDADPYDDPFSLSEPVGPKPTAANDAHDDPYAAAPPVAPTMPGPQAPATARQLDDASPTTNPPPPAPSYEPLPPGGLQHAGFTCPYCGYDLTGAVIGGTCPECGQTINPTILTTKQANGMAISSMIMGILALALGLFTLGVATIAFAPLGIIFGHIGSRQLRHGQYNSASKGFVRTGLICSYLAAAIVAITWGWFFIVIV